jgi:O-antigen/teichoic acid export membrane protein
MTSKVATAAISFITIPLLLNYFGKSSYGVLTLALAVNAYMRMMDLGMNTGAIKFFAQWRSSGKQKLLEHVARTSITFYTLIGLVNALILTLLMFRGQGLFNLSIGEFAELKVLLGWMAVFSVITWVGTVFQQLLVAAEQVAFTQQIVFGRSLLELLAAVITLKVGLSLNNYFVFFLSINTIPCLIYAWKCQHNHLISSWLPQQYWQEFRIVLSYSLGIFAMAFFQFSATQSRPLILALFASNAADILTEYRIIEVFPLFILSLGGVILPILLPRASQYVYRQDGEAIARLAYDGTLYTSVAVTLLCIPVMLCSQELLTFFVGTAYGNLGKWLVLWCGTILLYLPNTPVASLVLATGKFRMLVFSSALACIGSMICNALLCNRFGVGAAVIGYLFYIVVCQLFYYLYFNRNVLHLDSWRIFKSFAVPAGLGLLLLPGCWLLGLLPFNIILLKAVSLLLFLITYASCLHLFKIIDCKTILTELKKRI